MAHKKTKSHSRARAIGMTAARGIKGTAIDGVTGVAAYFAHSFASEKIDFVAKHWYAGPVGLAIIGHVLKRKPRTMGIGASLLGAAGYAGAFGYKLNKAAQPQKPAGTAGLTQPGDVSGLMSPVDPFALPDNSGTSAYAPVETTGYGDEDDYSVDNAMGLG